MKKTAVFLLIVTLVLTALIGLTGCNKNVKTPNENGEPVETPNDISEFEYEMIDSGVKITKYIGDSTSVVIPEKIEGKPVVELSSVAFFECRDKIEYISFPSGIKEIAHFGNSIEDIVVTYPALAKVRFKNGLETVCDGAFGGCTGLKEVILPSTLKTIGKRAFWNCTSLSEIKIPSSVTSVGEKAFYGCTSLKSISLPASIGGSLGITCFANSGLESVDIEEGITLIPDNAFVGTKLTSVILPSSVLEIGIYAFSECRELRDIKLNEGLLSIGNEAFFATALTELEIPASTKNFSEAIINGLSFKKLIIKGSLPEAFSTLATKDDYFGNENLYTIYLSKSEAESIMPIWNGHIIAVIGEDSPIKQSDDYSYVEKNDGTLAIIKYSGTEKEVIIPDEIDGKRVTQLIKFQFNSKSQTTSVTVPDSVTTIDYYCFYGCTNINRITLSNHIKEINDFAFYNSGIESIIIPSSLKKLSSSAFYYCKKLSEVKFEGDAPEIYGGPEYFIGSFSVFYHEGAVGFTDQNWNGLSVKTW